MLSRRGVLFGLGASGLLASGACGERGGLRARTLVAGGTTGPASGMAMAVRSGERKVFSYASGFVGGITPEERALGFVSRVFTENDPIRVASVSKTVVGLVALALEREGVLSLDADLRGDWPRLTHPDFPHAKVSLRHLLSHVSGLRDPETYWMALPGAIETLLAQPIHQPGAGPGRAYTYCNLGFGIAATIMERATAKRFDQLAHEYVFHPARLDIGFNWSGVSAAKRRRGITLYEWLEDETPSVTVDGPAVLKGSEPAVLAQPGYDLDDYVMGSNGTLFSPQGGLRASAEDLALLAGIVGRAHQDQVPTWLKAPGAQLHYSASGPGVFYWSADASPIPGVRMIGHDGEAYGVRTSAWYLPDNDSSFALVNYGIGAQPAPDAVYSEAVLVSFKLAYAAARSARP